MIPRIFAVADYASTSERKLNVLGVFGVIHAESVPCSHPQMWLVAQLEFDPMETGEKNVVITLEDPDGQLIISMRGQMKVPEAPEGQPSIVNQMVQLNNIVFPVFGRYEFKIQIDANDEIPIPVTVAHTTSH